MHFKHFTRLFLLMGMIGTFSLTAWAQQGEPITIGEGTSTTNEAPVHLLQILAYRDDLHRRRD